MLCIFEARAWNAEDHIFVWCINSSLIKTVQVVWFVLVSVFLNLP